MYSILRSSLVLFFLFFLFHSLTCASSKPEWCETQFQCGNITAGFPLWGGHHRKYCNYPLLELQCNDNITSLFISHQEFNVLHINKTSNTLTLARKDHLKSFCLTEPKSTALLTKHFELSPNYKSLTLYPCTCFPPNFSNDTCPGFGSFFHNPENHDICHPSFEINVPQSFVPEEKELNLTHLENVLREGFEVNVKIYDEECKECSSPTRTPEIDYTSEDIIENENDAQTCAPPSEDIDANVTAARRLATTSEFDHETEEKRRKNEEEQTCKDEEDHRRSNEKRKLR